MKREIKFRVWDSISKKLSGWNVIKDESLYGFSLEHYTLMQYTGLKDNNGVEIYVDDVLSDGQIIFRVYHTVGGFAIKARPWANNTKNPVLGDELIWQPLPDAQTIGYLKESCEVIGNIHKNPELLTPKQ